MNRLYLIRNLAVPALCALSLAACSSDSTGPKEPLIRTPKPGSGFIYSYYNKDMNGQPIDNTRKTAARTVIANNVTVMGMAGVVQYLEDADTISLHYDENGNASYLQAPITYPNDQFANLPLLPIPSFTIPARWITFPYGSRIPIAIPSFDTLMSANVGGLPIMITVMASGTTSYLGDENLSVSGETVATNKGLLTVNITFNAALLAGTISTVDTIWFAPKLGMFVKDDGFTRGDLPAQFGGKRGLGGTYSMLTSFSVK